MTTTGDAVTPDSALPAQSHKKVRGKRKPNYALIHKDSLPLDVYPLPIFHPTNPLSLLQLIWTCLRQVVNPPTSHQRLTGYFSSKTRSVHVTDPKHIRALWEKGFFGKGTLSRSEPSWMDREKARLAARSQGGQTAEEATKARREERRLFKLERARLEREVIERQKLVEQGLSTKDGNTEVVAEDDLLKNNSSSVLQQTPADNVSAAAPADKALDNTAVSKTASETEPAFNLQTLETKADDELEKLSTLDDAVNNTPVRQAPEVDLNEAEELDIRDQEHLQLTLEEAFFLRYALGVLDIQSDAQNLDNNRALFDSFRSISQFGAKQGMDDQFVLNYVVYHHFRSLGWVVRPGVKFSVDYLLYNRGPVFSHAEFAILIMPSYSHPFWSAEGRSLRKKQDDKDWWWLHCINRVQSQVKKTLVLVYVDIPPPTTEELTVEQFLRRYQVREFIVRRWLMNRSRD